ncbi:hypothetical protein HMPREF2928_03605 [Rothia sp. HMSC072B04]|nr:hypothetical protein HMPREF2928_03605 [Rothia sp. HMSC072B04]
MNFIEKAPFTELESHFGAHVKLMGERAGNIACSGAQYIFPRARLSILPDFVITQRLEGQFCSEKTGEMRHARSLYFCNYKERRKM